MFFFYTESSTQPRGRRRTGASSLTVSIVDYLDHVPRLTATQAELLHLRHHRLGHTSSHTRTTTKPSDSAPSPREVAMAVMPAGALTLAPPVDARIRGRLCGERKFQRPSAASGRPCGAVKCGCHCRCRAGEAVGYHDDGTAGSRPGRGGCHGNSTFSCRPAARVGIEVRHGTRSCRSDGGRRWTVLGDAAEGYSTSGRRRRRRVRVDGVKASPRLQPMTLTGLVLPFAPATC